MYLGDREGRSGVRLIHARDGVWEKSQALEPRNSADQRK